MPEAWTVLTALAEATRRITLGPLVLNTGLRHPGLLANMAATLQQVSGGRLLLGIGAGGHAVDGLRARADGPRHGGGRETGRARSAWPRRPRCCAGCGAETRRATRGPSSASIGPSGYLRPAPPPPIIVGGFGPRMAAIAGRHADGFNTQAMHPDLAELGRVAREAHAASGATPRASA